MAGFGHLRWGTPAEQVGAPAPLTVQRQQQQGPQRGAPRSHAGAAASAPATRRAPVAAAEARRRSARSGGPGAGLAAGPDRRRPGLRPPLAPPGATPPTPHPRLPRPRRAPPTRALRLHGNRGPSATPGGPAPARAASRSAGLPGLLLAPEPPRGAVAPTPTPESPTVASPARVTTSTSF